MPSVRQATSWNGRARRTRKTILAKARVSKLDAATQVIGDDVNDVLSMDNIDPVIVSENVPGNASIYVDIIDDNMNVSQKMTLPLSCDINSSISSVRSLRGQFETQIFGDITDNIFW